MLNNVKVEIRTGGDFEPVPMDRYTVQIADVNLVSQFNQFVGKEEDVLNYQFQILDEKPMPTKDGADAATTRGRFLWKRCRPAFNNRSWLGKLAKAAYGRDLTKDEVEAFDPEAIVGKQIDVMVEQSESKDGQKIFNNIVAFSKTARPLPAIADKESQVKKPGVVEKTTQPAVPAPGAEEAEAFVNGLEKENAGEAPAKPSVKAEEVDEVKDLEAKLAAAKKKAAKAKVAAK